MDSFNVMVVEANSNLGLEFVRQLVSLPYPPEYIFATYSTEENLKGLTDIIESTESSKIIMIKMDINLLNDIDEAKERMEQTIGGQSLNVLINTMRFREECNKISLEILERQFHEYTLPPLMLFQTMLPFLEAKTTGSLSNQELKSVFCNIIEDNSTDNHPLFEINKVALNLALDKIQKNHVLVFSRCVNVEEICHNNFSKRKRYVLSILLDVLSYLQGTIQDCDL